MSRVLSFDTSSEACSVCLSVEGVLYAESEFTPRQHATRLLPMIQNVLARADVSLAALDAIAFGCGPGSFTGLRIAAGVAQGLSYGSNCGVIEVSNLESIALRVSQDTRLEYVLVALDARMDEVYYGLFRLIRADSAVVELELVGQERVGSPESLVVGTDQDIYLAGSGVEFRSRFPSALQKQIKECNGAVIPMAEDIVSLAVRELESGRRLLSAQEVRPTYLRDTVAWKKLPGRE